MTRFSGALLREARYKAKLSMPALAVLAGISPDTIFNAEHGRSVPRGQTLYALAEALKLPVEAFMVAEGAEAS